MCRWNTLFIRPDALQKIKWFFTALGKWGPMQPLVFIHSGFASSSFSVPPSSAQSSFVLHRSVLQLYCMSEFNNHFPFICAILEPLQLTSLMALSIHTKCHTVLCIDYPVSFKLMIRSHCILTVSKLKTMATNVRFLWKCITFYNYLT